MAKNDYFSIVYKLLAILYDNLKDGVKTDLKAIINDNRTFPIDQTYWIAVFEDLVEKGYIKGVTVVPVVGDGRRIQETREGIRITIDGVEYLENNSAMKKAMGVWGLAKDFLPMATKVIMPL